MDIGGQDIRMASRIWPALSVTISTQSHVQCIIRRMQNFLIFSTFDSRVHLHMPFCPPRGFASCVPVTRVLAPRPFVISRALATAQVHILAFEAQACCTTLVPRLFEFSLYFFLFLF